MSTKYTKNTSMGVVAKKFPSPHWVFIHEFRNDTGFTATRFADGLAVGLYKSRGQQVIGFEQKVSRADWLRELKDPDKAEAICKYCDQWILVITDPLIAPLDEVPEMWGVWLVEGTKVKILRKAQDLSPVAMSREFLAALVKQSLDTVIRPQTNLREKVRGEVWSEAFETGKNAAGRELEQLTRLKKQVDDFEEASGVRITAYSDGKAMGKAVEAIKNSQQNRGYNENMLKADLRFAEQRVTRVREDLAAIQAAMTEISVQI